MEINPKDIPLQPFSPDPTILPNQTDNQKVEEVAQEALQQIGSISTSKQESLTLGKGAKATYHLDVLTSPELKKKLNWRLFFQIQGDEFGSHSKYEGYEGEKSVDYFVQFLAERKKQGLPSYGLTDEMISLLKNDANFYGIMKRYNDLPGAIEEELQDTNQRFLLGGWTGKPTGHAIYYEKEAIKPDGSTDVRLFDVGATMETHTQAVIGHKRKVVPVATLKDVATELLKDPLIAKVFFELATYQKMPSSSIATEYNQDDIQALNELLQPKMQGQDTDLAQSEVLMTLQRSGTCTWSSLLALLRTRMDRTDYKRLKLDIKLQSLKDKFESIQAGSEVWGIEEWNLMNKSLKKTYQQLLRAYAEGIISRQYLEDAVALLEPIGRRVKADKSILLERLEPTFSSPAAVDDSKLIHSPSLYTQTQNPSLEVSSSLPLFSQELIAVGSIEQATDVEVYLNQVLTLSEKAWKNKEDLALHATLSRWIQTLPWDEETWKKLAADNPDKAKIYMKQFADISHIYFKTCFTVPEAYRVQPERLMFFVRILYVYEQLLRHAILNQEIRVRSNFGNRYLFADALNRFFLTYHPEEQKWCTRYERDTEDIEKQIISASSGIISKDLPVGKRIGLKIGDVYFPPNNIFEDLLYTDSTLRQICEKNIPAFSEMNHLQQKAVMYASPDLPNWLKAIRDTHLYFDYLDREYITNLPEINRDKDLNLSFSIISSKEGGDCKVVSALEGLSGDLVNAETLKQIENEKTGMRYGLLQRPFKSQDFKKIESVMSGYEIKYPKQYRLEKELLVISAQEIGLKMTDEEFQELAYLFLSRPWTNLQLLHTLAYFTKYPIKLTDPDYQQLFRMNLFALNLLSEEIRSVPDFAHKLSSFLKENYQRNKVEKNIQACVFLLEMRRHCQAFSPDASLFPDTYSDLKALLNDKYLSPVERSLLYAELVASLGTKPSLSEEETLDLIKGLAFTHEHPIPSEWRETHVEEEMWKSAHLHAKEIGNVLSQRGSEWIAKLAQDVLPNQAAQEWDFDATRMLAISKDQTQIFFPLNGTFVVKRPKQKLPEEILAHSSFAKLFPTIQEAESLGNHLFAFEDSHGRKTLIKLMGEGLVIDQQFEPGNDDSWHRFIPSQAFMGVEDKSEQVLSAFASRYLLHHFSHWQSLSNPLSIQLRNEKGEEIYQAMLSPDYKQVEKITRIADGYTLVMPGSKDWDPKNASFSSFSHFENSSYIQVWKDPQSDVLQVELPRFGLSFTQNASTQAFISDQYSNFEVKSNARLALLGNFPHYLVLERKEETKLVLPAQQFIEVYNPESLRPNFKIDQKLKLEDQGKAQKALIFDIKEDKTIKDVKIVAPTRSANLQLALDLTVVQKYKKAAALLRRYGEKLAPYTEEERNLLKSIGEIEKLTGDKNQQTIALAVYANYLYWKDYVAHVEAKEPMESLARLDFIRTFKDQYLDYLNYKEMTSHLKLKPHEEKYICALLMTDSQAHLSPIEERILLNREEELSGGQEEVSQMTIFPPDQAQISSKPSKTLDKLLEEFIFPQFSRLTLVFMSSFHFDPLLLTRAFSEINDSFYACCGLALKDPSLDSSIKEERKKLEIAVCFGKHTKNEGYYTKCFLLDSMLKHPHEYPPFPTDPSTIDDWKQQVIDICLKLSSKPQTVLEKPLVVPVPQPQREKEISSIVDPSLRISFSYQEPPSLEQACHSLFTQEQREKIKANLNQMPEAKEGTTTLQEELPKWLDKAGNPVAKEEIKRLIDDVKIHKAKAPVSFYALTPASKEALKTALQKDKVQEEAEIEKLKQEIDAIANQFSNDPEQKIVEKARRAAGFQPKLKLDELIVNFARQAPLELIERNPAFRGKEEEIKVLYEKIGAFLALSTKQAQINRSEKLINRLETLDPNSIEAQETIQDLAATVLTKRSYDPKSWPAFLVFEYYADLNIREDQVQKLELFLSKKDQSPLLEMIMGSGKSKILLPILGMILAETGKISLLIVPQPLFTSVSQDTQSTLDKAFASALHSMQFDRNSSFKSVDLKGILEELISIESSKECLMMTSKSLECLILKFMETSLDFWDKYEDGMEVPKELVLMATIIQKLRDSGVPIIDEVDSVLNVLFELCFSTGAKTPIRREETAVISSLYSIFYDDKTRKRFRLESDPTPNPTAPILTKENFSLEHKLFIAERFLEKLSNLNLGNVSLNEKAKRFVSSLTVNDQHLALAFLCQNEQLKQEAKIWFDQQDSDVQNILALASQEISQFLGHTLSASFNEKYGIDDQASVKIAIPFSGANTPSYGSQFASPHITMNYTFQAYVKEGISSELLKKEFEKLQNQAQRERKKKNIPLEETQAYQRFRILVQDASISLFNYKEQEIEELKEKINSTIERKLQFVSDVILPQIELFQGKIAFNPHNLSSFFNHIMGFTGTLWNSQSLSRKFKALAEAGTDAKTLSLLWQNSRHAVHGIKEGSSKELLEQIENLGITFDMVSDSGGYFKKESNQANARQMALLSAKPVVFYNTAGDQTLTNGKEETPFDPSKHLPGTYQTFLDQNHTTGADVKQKENAISLVTISRSMLLRDLFQSVWRLRGLAKSQKAVFLISEEVQVIIRQSLGMKESESIRLDEILQFCIKNQAERQSDDNFKAFKEEIWDIPQMILLQAFLSLDLSPEEKKQTTEKLKSTWVRINYPTAKELYGKLEEEQDKSIIVKEEKQKCLEFLIETLTALPFLEAKLGISYENLEQEIDKIAKRMEPHLTDKLSHRENIQDQTTEVIKEIRAEVERETRQESVKSKIELGLLNDSKYQRLKKVDKLENDIFKFKDSYPYFKLEHYLRENKELKDYATCFEGIDIALNVFEWPSNLPYVSRLQLFGGFRPTFRFFLKQGENLLILSEAEARTFKNDLNFINLPLGAYHHSQPLEPVIKEKLLKVKFLNGESNYSKDEMAFLEKWLIESGPQKMHDLFHQHILPGLPGKIVEYQAGSELKDLFERLTTENSKPGKEEI